ncbi:glutathione S-transferase family protein [uncultured Roseovarius sp.]|uniref:glutathione S-transferase family protein n=1 Tax=uncultured Roseovarius sp. TaxID=293344 RepID=UPI00262ED1A8|nr:glutathione S-transferase family protein [uncultured Roseovarius sp.]
MKLVSADASPFARKIRVLLHEADLTADVSVLSAATTPLNTDPTVAAANPMGKIPTLIRDDGPAIYDSRVISRFLNDHADAGLYPDSRLWETLTLEATADGIMDAAVLMTYEKRLRPPEHQSEDWLEAQWKKVAGAVGVLENRWMSHLTGPFDMSHIAVGCALAYLDFRHGDRNWRKGNDALDDWFAVFAERDSMKATVPA